MNDNTLKFIKKITSEVKHRKRAGRPRKGDNEKKVFRRFSISVDVEQYKSLEEYAQEHYEGNISLLVRKLLKEKDII